MESEIGVWLALGLGAVPVAALLVWWWNEVWYAIPVKVKCYGTGTKLPPGDMGFPIIGEIISFLWYFSYLGKPDDFIHHKRRKYGDGAGMYRTHLLGSPAIITCVPSTNKFVLQSSDLFQVGWPNTDIVGTSSLVTVRGEAHARLRTFVTNAINTPDSLGRIVDMIQPQVVASLHSWALQGTITTYDMTKKLTFENIGKHFLSLEAGPQLDTIDGLFSVIFEGMRSQPYNIPGTAYYRACQCRKRLDVILKVELDKKKSLIQNGAATAGNDLMDELMQTKDKEGKNLNDEEVLDNIVALMAGAYVSTAYAGMWAIYWLAKSPHVLDKLREENMAIKQTKDCEFITSEDLSKMKYTKKVVEESIRMANVAGMIIRSATEDVDYKGYRIPKGWKVILWLRYLHTSSENFDDPLCFNPDRWDKPLNPGAFQAFGGGARICPGNMLARLQLAILLHHLSLGYKWELINPDAKIAYVPHPTPVDGAQVSFTKI